MLCVTAFSCVSCSSLTKAPFQQGLQKNLTVRTTAYTHNESDHIKYGKSNAIGTTLKCDTKYSSAASDWSFLPVGTVFSIKQDPHTYVIDDYGSALVGTKTIDIYRPSRRSMNQWGVRVVDISIVRMGDYHKSLQTLQDRCRYPHIRQMVAQIKQKI